MLIIDLPIYTCSIKILLSNKHYIIIMTLYVHVVCNEHKVGSEDISQGVYYVPLNLFQLIGTMIDC